MKLKAFAFALSMSVLSLYSCQRDQVSENGTETVTPPPSTSTGLNLNIAAEGTYPNSDVVYVDENFKSVSKDKAKFYLKKQLLGKQLVPNNDITFDYWKDKQYFSNTPIVNYIYHYHDIKDDKLFFSANASELEGYTHYIFHGLTMWVQKNDKLKLTGGFAYGKLHGDFGLYDDAGDILERYWYTNGVKGSVILKKADFYAPLQGKWEADLENDGYFRKTQVYDLKSDGTLEFYQASYIKNRTSGAWELWSSNTDTAKGLWKFVKKTDTTGEGEFYYKGLLAMKTDVKILSPKDISLKSTYLDKMFDQSSLGTELKFSK